MADPITTPADIVQELNRRLMAREPEDFGTGCLYMPSLARVKCADGFNISIQASELTYCTPRSNYGPWIEVECGFPSAPMPDLIDYCEAGDRDATKTVWGYTPIKRVAEVLASHGGILPAAE